MSLLNRLIKFKELGLFVILNDEKLSVQMTDNKLSEEDKNALKENKSEIIELFNKLGICSSRLLAPTSFSQQRLWFIDQLEEGTSNYNIIDCYPLHDYIDLTALKCALKSLCLRHEILRTTYIQDSGHVFQVLNTESKVTINVHDFKGLDERHAFSATQVVTAASTDHIFDLKNGPILKVDLCQVHDGLSYLVINIHHIASDGWSQNIIRDELKALYESFSKADSAKLPELTLQFADYAHWERNYLQGDNLKKHLSYWSDRLRGLPNLHSLPLDMPRPVQQNFEGGEYISVFSNDLLGKFKKICDVANASLFMGLNGMFSYLLSRLSDEDDIVFATPIANREQAETAELIGFFVNTLVLRYDLSCVISFDDLLNQAKEVCLGAYAHQQMPLDELIQHLNIPRSLSYTPLFQIMFSTVNIATSSEINNTYSEEPRVNLTKSKFDLSVTCLLEKDKICFSWNYNSSLFDKTTIQNMAEFYENLLVQATSEPQKPLSEFPLKEIKKVNLKLNNEKFIFVHKLLEQKADSIPDHIAVETPNASLSYSSLNNKVNQFVNFLLEKGITVGNKVIVCLEESEQLVISIFAILKLGACYITIDKSCPVGRINKIINDVNAFMIITTANTKYKPNIKTLVLNNGALNGLLENEPVDNLDFNLSQDSLAYISYTSGSTGDPKGVMVTHKNLSSYLKGTVKDYRITHDDTILQFSSVAFDIFVEELFCTICRGAKLIFEDKSLLKDVDYFTQTIKEKLVSVVSLPTAFFHILCENSDILKWDYLVSLRLVIVGGEKLSANMLDNWKRNTKIKVLNTYGPTEATVISTIYDTNAHSTTQSNIPIGKPIEGVRCYIFDKHKNICPDGVIGELYIAGDTVSKGYCNNQQFTDELFVSIPAISEAKLYKTGDIARYLKDGNIEFIGRKDEQVKINGYRVELGEIEYQLAQLEVIESVVVLAKETKRGDKQLVAYIKASQNEVLCPKTSKYLNIETANNKAQTALREIINTKLSTELPSYMIPIYYVLIDEWQLSSTGKIDKKSLLELTHKLISDEYVAPITTTEKKLANIWLKLLELSELSIEANFFGIGGHSLLAVRLMADIRKQFGVRISLKSLFLAPTIKQLSVIIDDTLTSAINKPEAGIIKQNISPILTLGNYEPSMDNCYFIPGIAGTANMFADFSQIKSFGFNIKAFSHRGLMDGKQPFTSIEDNACHFVKLLLAEDIADKYIIVGHSFGGVIALEMTRLLELAGKKVKLILIDSYFEQHLLNKKERNETYINTDQSINNEVKLSAIDTLLKEDVKILHQRQLELFKHYKPKSLPVINPLILFAIYSSYDVDNYLERLNLVFTGGVTYHYIDGDHFSMLKDKGSKQICSKIMEFVN